MSILWSPSSKQKQNTSLWRFSETCGFEPSDYTSLHRWSVSDIGAFWSKLWDFTSVIGKKGKVAFKPDEDAQMTGARFFPDASLNLAENLLMRGAPTDIAVCSSNEQGDYAEFTRKELQTRVFRVASGLRSLGIRPGDCVAGVQGNTIDALVATLATLSVGGIWTSCSPDFGVNAIVDRIGQVAPKVLFASVVNKYGGKEHNLADRIQQVKEAVPSIEAIVVSDGELDDAIMQSQFIGDDYLVEEPFNFERLPFDHSAYVLYTSGTTGAPKAIVHRAGGVILQHMKEHILHGDVQAGDRVIWYTNTAWMMYHWTISALATGAAVVLYDGAPILKADDGLDCSPLWDLVDRAAVTHLGVSPKYLATLAAEEFLPSDRHKLETLRALLVCGAPCLPHQFDWVYEHVKQDMMFASISGGTEILGSFLIGSPIHPVRRGQLTIPALGHSMAVMDERNAPVIGQRGDLVCTEPFPSMPLTFWGEGGDQRYHDTYFSERPEIWTHGDVAELTSTGGGYVHGRSDNTLKPGGVRIGISEIYAVCETYAELEDFLVFGANHDGDEEVVLAIKTSNGAPVSPEVVRNLRKDIRQKASPRHVPARIHQVSEVPYTVNGKRVEGAARTVVNGGKVKNLGSIANAQCLDQFASLKRENSL